MLEHGFTARIKEILSNEFGEKSELIINASDLLQYLNIKTKSASSGSKSRGSFGNLYAIYVTVEDYIEKGYCERNDYDVYDGAKFTDLLARQRELPFGTKLQNHALNHRLNQEFKKYFPTNEYIPILRDAATSRYWINENLINISVSGEQFNIAKAILKIIDAYVEAKRDAFDQFIASCEQIEKLQENKPEEARSFIIDLLKPNVDARVFEIVSFAILKAYYSGEVIYWGWTTDSIQEDQLTLYKTGRTNANDGGIDFVMRPLGRFFQVTETTDVKKYFLDIDKVQRFPITFVVKSTETRSNILSKIKQQAKRSYGVENIVNKYIECVEEIINIPVLLERFEAVFQDYNLSNVVEEIITQSKVEFNYQA